MCEKRGCSSVVREMKNATDDFLLQKFHKEGSQAAFETLVNRYAPMVHGVGCRVLGDRAEAEEAAQATFMALALKAGRLDGQHGLGGWLHRVARQVSLDLRKAALRRRTREEEAGRRERLEGPHRGAIAETASGGELDEAIARLPARLREAVIGHYLEGRSMEELAARHGCSASAISMRLTRARKRLHEALRGWPLAGGWPVLEGGAGLSEQFVPQTFGVIKTALAGLAASESAGVRLLHLAQASLQRLWLERLRWVAVSGATGVAVVGIGLAVAAEKLRAAPSIVLPAETPRAIVLPTPVAEGQDAGEGVSQEAAQEPPLIREIRTGDYPWERAPDFLRLLEQQSEPLDAIRDAHGRGALHWAVRRGWSDYSVLLLLRGADVNAVDERGYTPLFDALTQRHVGLQRLLLLAGANVNHEAPDGMTPLLYAIAQGDLEVTERLLWLGAWTSVPDAPPDRQPLAVAKARGDARMIELIEDYVRGANGEGSPFRPATLPTFVKNSLHEAARTGDFEKLQAFLRGGAPIDLRDEKGRTALYRAISAGQDEVVFYLIVLGANPNVADEKKRTPLMETMGWLGGGLDDMRRFLILRKASPFAVRADRYNELTWAVKRDNEHGVQWLLWLGAKGREKTEKGTPFQIAFEDGRQRIMDLLKRNGIEEPIRLSDDPVWNLHNAARRGDRELLLQMLAQGVEIDAPDAEGHSPLLIAIATRNVPIARELLDRGAAMEFRNAKTGITPLHMTTIWDYGEMTAFREELLQAGANPNVPNAKGETPVMRALWHQPTTPLKQLLEYGGDPYLKDKQGLNAIDRARRDGKTETAEFLEAYVRETP